MKRSALFVLGFTTFLAAAGCSSKSAQQAEAPQAPIASNVEQEIIDGNRPTLDPNETHSVAVRVKVTVDRDAILNQEFLYGADLQYSSFYDKDMDLYNQSLALGHVPVRFREVGDELQLIADDRRLFPSENNHPEQLVSRFKIHARTAKTLTISSLDSRVFLGELFSGTVNPNATSAIDPAGQPPRDLWVRSFDYAREGNYLLQQTSVVLSDGSIAEFMEAVFPRRTLTPGADFQKFAMDPTSDTGSMQPGDVMERFRLLPGEQIFEIGPQFTGEERKVAYGAHFDLSGGKTIDFYVTRNIRDNEIPAVQQAVEGWNRYFTKFKGIKREIVKFKGRLPQGIHIGDPRFNVINWDSRLVAGAAYESQATDPNTGAQSHSLIYMPAAWLQIGKDYWTLGQASDQKQESVAPAALRGKSLLAKARIACVRDVRGAAADAASGRFSPSEIDEFATRLLKQTLFHEVGHSLGLAHNFKGSLSFDRSKPDSMFSTSIMDYNDFEIERAAFAGLNTSDGPQLEYDRQVLSAIYDKGADIAATDAVVPACNDAEADHQAQDGVDPLCIRYDIEHDPTHSVVTGLDRISQATLTGDVSLAQALRNVPGIVLTDDAVAQARTEDGFGALSDKLAATLRGSIKFYLVSGKASLSRVVRTNVKSLLVFEQDILPSDYDERGMRERAFDGVQKSLALKALPDAVKAAVADAEKAAIAKLARTPYAQGLAAADAQKLAGDVKKSLDDAVNGVQSAALATLHAAVLTSVARHSQVDFFLGKLASPQGSAGSDAQLDYETAIVGQLTDAVLDTARTRSERVAAATSLATYAGRRSDDAIARVTTAVTAERAAAVTNASLDAAIAVLAALSGSSGS